MVNGLRLNANVYFSHTENGYCGLLEHFSGLGMSAGRLSSTTGGFQRIGSICNNGPGNGDTYTKGEKNKAIAIPNQHDSCDGSSQRKSNHVGIPLTGF